MFATLNLKYLNSRISRVQLTDGVSLVVVDRQGTVLASSSTVEARGARARDAALLKSVMGQRGRGTEEVTDNDGVQRMYAYYPIGAKRGAEAYVSVSIPASIALAEANQELAHNLLGLTVVSLLALAAAWFGGHAVVLHKANDELEERVQERTKELAHEQLLLRMLMDSMPDTIYFKDTQSRFTRVNRAQALVLGVDSPDQAVGKNDADFFTAEHAQAALADERRILESGKGLISKTERIRRADGRFRWVTATKVPLRDAGGTVVGLAGISRDVTERMIAENLLRVLVDNLPDLVYIKDTQGHYVMDNATHRNFLGLRTAEQIVGKTAFDFYPKDLAERIRADDETVLESKIGVVSRRRAVHELPWGADAGLDEQGSVSRRAGRDRGLGLHQPHHRRSQIEGDACRCRPEIAVLSGTSLVEQDSRIHLGRGLPVDAVLVLENSFLSGPNDMTEAESLGLVPNLL